MCFGFTHFEGGNEGGASGTISKGEESCELRERQTQKRGKTGILCFGVSSCIACRTLSTEFILVSPFNVFAACFSSFSSSEARESFRQHLSLLHSFVREDGRRVERKESEGHRSNIHSISSSTNRRKQGCNLF